LWTDIILFGKMGDWGGGIGGAEVYIKDGRVYADILWGKLTAPGGLDKAEAKTLDSCLRRSD